MLVRAGPLLGTPAGAYTNSGSMKPELLYVCSEVYVTRWIKIQRWNAKNHRMKSAYNRMLIARESRSIARDSCGAGCSKNVSINVHHRIIRSTAI